MVSLLIIVIVIIVVAMSSGVVPATAVGRSSPSFLFELLITDCCIHDEARTTSTHRGDYSVFVGIA
jgi:hypothetical protein